MRLRQLSPTLGFCFLLSSVAAGQKPADVGKLAAGTSKESQACIACHLKGAAPLAVQQWAASRHAQVGIGCYECHQADKARPDAFEHFGVSISVMVTPKSCGTCHRQEAAEFQASHHAQAGQILGSLDNVLGEDVEGPAAAAMGCAKCHGSIVKVVGKGKLDPATWPNEGIGRLNPDGSKGSCSACHFRHGFSRAQARMPENCGRCHLGPDHPQAEIYAESKHGIQFRANIDKMNLESKSWIVGKDYSAAPTCATCHMSATSNQKITHDVGDRISFTLRPAISIKLDNWEKRRAAMKDVCSNCHATGWVENFYTQYEGTIDLYNEKFAKPAKAIMDKLYAAGKLTKTPFDEKIEWIYYELWHHQGRRARMGTAMMGPDYTQWHGFYEVAKSFYMEFIPEAERLMPGVTADVMKSDFHKWTAGLTKEQIQQQIDFYKQRYKQ